MEEYLNQQDELSPLIKLAVQHYQFESIYPFYDGNGRTGRIIKVLYLVLHGQSATPILYLSDYMINNKADYYQLLQKVRTTGQWEEWILFMLQSEAVSKVILRQPHQVNCTGHRQKLKTWLPAYVSGFPK